MSNNYNHFGATHLVAGLSVISSAPSLYADLRAPTRVYDVEGGAIFSKNSTFESFRRGRVEPALTVFLLVSHMSIRLPSNVHYSHVHSYSIFFPALGVQIVVKGVNQNYLPTGH